MTTWLLLLAALVTSCVGALGGLGGAVLLVPLLVMTGMPASQAAPLGLLSVGAGSVAAADRQLREQLVNHRIGVVTETTATVGALAGALLAGMLAESVLTRILAAVALVAGLLGGRRTGLRNLPDPALGEGDVGEWPGTLAGAYRLGDSIVPYRARRLGLGLAAMSMSGLIAGLAGVSGGFVKSPAASEIMAVPVKVAGAITSFTIGVTSSAALMVMVVRGRIDVESSAYVIAGSLLGGIAGASLQARLSPVVIRRLLSVLLVAVAVLLALRA